MPNSIALSNKVVVRPEPVCGAWVEGIDFSEPISDELIDGLRHELHRWGVLFFRDQDLTLQQHVEFARRFGQTYVSPYLHPTFPEFPEMFVLTEADRGGAQWHTDTTFEDIPPLYVVLHSQVIPSSGGDTIWASMTAAYDALSPAMRELIEGKHAVHDFMHSTYRDVHRIRKAKNPELYKVDKTAVHPVVITDPVTGRKSLYVNELYTTRIEELAKEESDAVLKILFQHLAQPEFQVRLNWRPKTIAMWNNEVVQHYPLADYTEDRRMNRVAILTDRRPS